MRAFAVGLGLALWASACLPEPPKKSILHATIRGSLGPSGKPEFDDGQGLRVRFQRRVAVLGVTSVDLAGSGRRGEGSLRNLDEAPFAAPDTRGLGESYVSAYGSTFYDQPSGPGIVDSDRAALEGQRVDRYTRSNLTGFRMQGTIETQGRVLTFDWRGSFTEFTACGRAVADFKPGALSLEPETEHNVDVVVHTEAPLLALGGDALFALDQDNDGHLSDAEFRDGSRPLIMTDLFEVRFDGEPLSCVSGYDVLRSPNAIPFER